MSKKTNKSPSIIRWMLSRTIDKSLLEEFLGDLHEMYVERLPKGRFYASLMRWVDALHLTMGFISIGPFRTQNTTFIMFRSMFKIAWRNALRQKQFTLLNIVGLTFGISTCTLIGLYVHDELTYDTFHEKGERIYRVNQPNIWGDWDRLVANTGPNVAVALREDAPEFEQVTRLLSLGSQTVTTGVNDEHTTAFKETRFYAAEENFFDVFSFDFLVGNPKTVFLEPMNMVVTLETARRYFGQDIFPEEAVGKTVELKDYDGSWKTYTVRGVVTDVPHKSHLQFDVLVSLKSQSEMMRVNGWKWIWTAFSTYGLVKEGVDVGHLEEKLQAIPPKWAPPTTERIFNQSFEEFTNGYPWKLDLQPLTEIYSSGSPSVHSFGPTGNPQFVKIFGAIGILVLLLSAINFMNLSTARSANRAKEVGIRKVLGSERKALLYQFVMESILFVMASTLLAFFIVHLSIDEFNALADKNISLLPHFNNPVFYGIIIVFIVLLGLLAGSYPAFYLSGFKPIETLKGKLSVGFNGKGIRNGLVVFQFTISIALIICTFFVQKQLSYASAMDVGFARNNILQLHNIEQFGFDTEALKTKLESNPAFIKVGKSYGLPPNIWSGDRYKAKGEDQVVQLSNVRTEEDYLDLLGLEFIAGRNFDANRPNDKYKVVLNETAVKTLGWGKQESFETDSPVGKVLKLASGDEDEFEVIGVVKDFNFNSVKREILPLVVIHHQNDKVWDYRGGLSFYSMRLDPARITNSNDLLTLLDRLEAEIAELDVTVPFEYSFLDQEFENTFRSEQRMGTVLNLFVIMAVVIACLGLFGLAAFTAEQRTKELGIRKVLGANVTEIVWIFSSEFTKLILVSILIATPVTYYLVDQWLAGFAYRTPIDVWVFAFAAFVALTIAVVTIGYQSITTANKNPVLALKDE